MFDKCFPSQLLQPNRRQTPFLVRPKKPKKIERRNTITFEPSHNESTNDPWSPHNRDICNTNQQNQTLTLHIYPNEYFIPSCSLNKKETCLRAFTLQIPFQGKAVEEEPHRAL